MNPELATAAQLLAIVTAAILGYWLLRCLGLVVTQPFRLRMAEIGEAALTDPCVPDDEKDTIRQWLDHAFDGRFVLFLAALSPAFLIGVPLLLVMRRFRAIHPAPKPAPQFHPATFEVFRLGMLASAGVSPLATLLLLIELICLSLLFRPVASLSRQLALAHGYFNRLLRQA